MDVKVHNRAKEQLAAWRRSLGANPQERALLWKRFWAEFVQTLRDADVPPPGSVAAPELGSAYWWVAFPPCYLALVNFRTNRGLFGWFRRRLAVVMRIVLSPGPSV